MKKLTLITGNLRKKIVAEKVFSKHNIKLETASLDHDESFQEVQLWNCEDIALHSARSAVRILQKPVMTTDVGYYFETFGHGFPGPYIKWFNEGLDAEDILRLMKGKENRKVIVKEAVAYCDCEGNEVSFSVQDIGRIAHKRSKNKGWTSVNEVLILKGMNKPLADYDDEEVLKLVHRKESYRKLVGYLKGIWNLEK